MASPHKDKHENNEYFYMGVILAICPGGDNSFTFGTVVALLSPVCYIGVRLKKVI